MTFWKRWRQRRDPEGWLSLNRAPDFDGGWNATSMPASLEPKLNESKTRVYDDEVEEDWRDPITEADDD